VRRDFYLRLYHHVDSFLHPADHESTLFRGNSFATRILTVYARARGYHYLRNTLKDLLHTLCQKPPEFSMVIPPFSLVL